MAKQYAELSSQIKLLEESKKELSTAIKEASEELGVKDSKGSFFCDTSEYITGKVAKKSVTLNESLAIPFLKGKGLNNCIETVTLEKVNEKCLSNAVSEGKITQKEFESLCNIKTTYSVSVQKKEEMPEVDVTHCVAASKK